MISTSFVLRIPMKRLATLTVLMITAVSAFAIPLTPIARWNTVPHQRVDEPFKAGVVAFSKEGISQIEFTITGQGYSGPNPVVVSQIRLNDRLAWDAGMEFGLDLAHTSWPGVWEYWFELDPRDFASNGEISISVDVYGNDGGHRRLDDLNLVVNATGSLAQHSAWVTKDGNDSTGAVNNSNAPFASVSTAAAALVEANGGTSDGTYLYLGPGQWNINDHAAPNAGTEWYTIAAAPGTSRGEVVAVGTHSGSVNTELLRLQNLKIVSTGKHDRVGGWGPTLMWVHRSEIEGYDRWHTLTDRTSNFSNPVMRPYHDYYYTESYFHGMDDVMKAGIIGRNLVLQRIGNDAFQDTHLVVNIRLDDHDPGPTTGWHSDAYQSFGQVTMENVIVYNYYATDLHYQGLFLRGTEGIQRNNAFVNLFFEMREPGRNIWGGGGGEVVLRNGGIWGRYEHLLVWHSTFPTRQVSIYSDDGGSATQSEHVSYIGTVFFELMDNNNRPGGTNPAYFSEGNTLGNEFVHNHYYQTATDQDIPQGGLGHYPLVHWYSISPHTGAKVTKSVGDMGLQMDRTQPETFGSPLTDSVLSNRVEPLVVPADAFGNPRPTPAAIGALEPASASAPPPPNAPEAPTGIRVEGQ